MYPVAARPIGGLSFHTHTTTFFADKQEAQKARAKQRPRPACFINRDQGPLLQVSPLAKTCMGDLMHCNRISYSLPWATNDTHRNTDERSNTGGHR